MRGHEATLAGISMGEEGARQGLIEASKEDFDRAHGELKHAFENQAYTGSDNLGVTLALLRQLSITVNIESLTDMNFIVQGMESQDLADVLSQYDVRSQVIQQLTRLEDLVILAMETSNTKLPIVLHALEAHVHTLIRTPQDLAALLISLQVDKIEVILQALNDKLPDMIKRVYNFNDVLERLSPEQRIAVILAMSDQLPEIIKRGTDFADVLYDLSREQRTLIFEVMRDKLSDIIKNGCGLDAALAYLTSEQRTSVYEAMKDKLPDIIKNGEEFSYALRRLTPEQCTAVYETMSDKLPKIIRNDYELGAALKYLTPEQCTAVTLAIKDKLPDIIKNGYDFKSVLSYLKPEKRTAVILAMSDKLPDIIKNGYDFKSVLSYLTPEKRTAVILAMSDKLPGIIKNSAELGAALEYLNSKQSRHLLDIMKGQLPGMMGKYSSLDTAIKEVLGGSQQGFFATPRAAKINVGGLEKKLTQYIEARKEEYSFHWDFLYIMAAVNWLCGEVFVKSKETKLNAATYALRSHKNEDACLVKLKLFDVMPTDSELKNHTNSYVLVGDDGVTKALCYIDYEGNSRTMGIKDLSAVTEFFTSNADAKLTYDEISLGLKDAVAVKLPTDAQLEALKEGLLGDIMVGANEGDILNGTKRPMELDVQNNEPGV